MITLFQFYLYSYLNCKHIHYQESILNSYYFGQDNCDTTFSYHPKPGTNMKEDEI